MYTGGGGQVKGFVLRRFLKIAIEVAERTDGGRLFQGEGAQDLSALSPALVLILGHVLHKEPYR